MMCLAKSFPFLAIQIDINPFTLQNPWFTRNVLVFPCGILALLFYTPVF